MNKIAVITGATSGLGRAMAGKFKAQGFFVVGLSRHQPEADVCDRWIKVDLTDVAERSVAVEELIQLPGIDVLVNNAGVGAYAAWGELSENDLRQLMELDFFVPVLLTKALLPQLRRSKATVVNISSVAGLLPVACMGAYSAGKAAVRMFSETLRTEEREIKVVTVYPGRINTGFGSRAYGCRQVPNTPSHGSETPEMLAKKVYRAYKCSRRQLVYPAWYRLVIGVLLKFPGIYERGSRKIWKI